MNAIKHIRTEIFRIKQAPFAELAGVSQPTVSRWESDERGSEPTREEMDKIRQAAVARGLPWNDEWFFRLPSETAA
jgi:transcriptional regulator with XRE-family HTH domain